MLVVGQLSYLQFKAFSSCAWLLLQAASTACGCIEMLAGPVNAGLKCDSVCVSRNFIFDLFPFHANEGKRTEILYWCLVSRMFDLSEVFEVFDLVTFVLWSGVWCGI